MSVAKKLTIIVIGIIVLIGLWFWSSYNSLVNANEVVTAQWAQVESQYQRRFDLIPNLVNSVKGIMKQEQAVFDAIATARTQYQNASTIDGKAQAATQIEGALSNLLVVVENYPSLKSADTVQTLMSQLEGTENRISVERMRFNQDVQVYDTMIKRFPANIVAGWLGFSERSYFKVQNEAANTAPTVNL